MALTYSLSAFDGLKPIVTKYIEPAALKPKKMSKKNKSIRLAAAKKTIERLEKKK